MSDLFSGIKQIGPTYPIRPVEPAVKDREPDERKKEKRYEPKGGPKGEPKDQPHDDDSKPIIDELV